MMTKVISYRFLFRPTLLLLIFLYTVSLSATPISAIYNNEGIGILSDSNADEYRADDNRGGIYATTTLNWVELLYKYRSLNFGQWGSWGEPRRSGYKYNWSRSGYLTRDLIDGGLAQGLANQITNGEITYVFIEMGTNDFNFWNNTYQEIYNGTLSDTQVQEKVNIMISKMSQTIDILMQAGAINIIMTGIGDPNNFPPITIQFPIQENRDRVTNAVNAVNAGWKAKANATSVIFFDMNQWMLQNIVQKLDVGGNLLVGDQTIQLYTQGDEPHYFRLGDSAGHLGTVANGIIANGWFLELFNTNHNWNITPFSSYEILTNAGINSSLPTPTQSPTPTTQPPSPTPTPKPGDVDGGDVTLSDLAILLANFGGSGKTRAQGDVANNDGLVNLSDLSLLLANFGR